MRAAIITLIILIASVWLGLVIAKDPGIAYFSYHHWSIEMPLWLVVIGALAAVWLLYLIIHFFDEIADSFSRWKNWLRWRRKSRAYNKTNRGLLELIEGHWRYAENALLDGIAQSDTPLINYLGAAKAAHERQAFDKRDFYLRKAHELAPRAEIPIGLTQAQLQFQQGQLEQALATLNHLRQIAPKHVVVLKLLERVYTHLADWNALLALLPSLRKAKVFPLVYLDKLEIKLYEEALKATAIKCENIDALRAAWRNIPRKVQAHPELVYCYANAVLQYPNTTNEVEDLIYRALKKTWDDNLAKLYGVLVTDNPKKQLAHADKWLKLYPNQPMLFLTLGRLSLCCQLWGKARSCFEDSLRMRATPEVYLELGKLMEQLDDVGMASQYYRDGLALKSLSC